MAPLIFFTRPAVAGLITTRFADVDLVLRTSTFHLNSSICKFLCAKRMRRNTLNLNCMQFFVSRKPNSYPAITLADLHLYC